MPASLRKLLVLISLIFIFGAQLPGNIIAEASVDVQPLLIIEKVNTEKAIAGDFFYITLVIKNYSDFPAFNVSAEVSTPGEKENFFVKKIETQAGDAESCDLEKIEGQQTRSLTFAVNVDPRAENKDYNVLITLKSDNALFEPAPQSSASVKVPVVFELTQPHITVDRVALDPQTPAAQESFTAVFYLDNFSSAEARNVTVTLDGLSNFKVVDFTNSKFLKTVTRGAGDFVLFKLQGLEKRSSNSVKLKLAYDSAGGKNAEAEVLVNLPLGHCEPGSSPFLKVSSFSLESTPRSGEHLFQLTLENLGQEAAQDISLTLDGGTNIYILDTSNIDYIKNIDGKTTITREYSLGINSSQGAAHYPLKVLLSYSDRSGNSYTSDETLGISAAAMDAAATAGKPRVIVSKYSLSEEKILAGNVVTLSLFIENTHARAVQNIKVALGVIQVEGEGGTSSGGTVFSPVNSSNSFFIAQIPARTTIEKNIDLYVDPNATAKTYIVPITIEYEDQQANSYSASEMVNIPVTQECKLQILSLEVPPVAFAGQPAFVGAEFVNVGKVALNNFIVMLEGDFHKEQASYYVGNLQIGESDFYQGTIFPEGEGRLSGKLIFSYIDNNNKEVQIEESFDLDVQAMGAPQDFPGGKEGPGMSGPGRQAGDGSVAQRAKRALYWFVPLVVVGAGAIIYWRRRKNKKKNEEFLDA